MTTAKRAPKTFDERVSEYKAYLDVHAANPRIGDPDDASRSLANWLNDRRAEDRAGTLDPGRGAALDAVNPDWRVTRQSPTAKDRRVAEYQAYWNIHRANPKPHVNDG